MRKTFPQLVNVRLGVAPTPCCHSPMIHECHDGRYSPGHWESVTGHEGVNNDLEVYLGVGTTFPRK